ncbi:MAG: gamma-glutamyl-gamma-aminobutyrate hydrolase family protein [Alphaproteobacteria bacterium]
MKKPVIGVILDFQEEGGGFSSYPWHALRSNYFDKIRDAGGIPFGIPCTYPNPEDYMSFLDGVLATGGNDYDPVTYNETLLSDHVRIMRQRSISDLAMIRATLKHKKPLLAICAGFQALNIIYGGTLHQHLVDDIKTEIEHKATCDPSKPVHPVALTPGTHLHQILHHDEIMVNSFHHQALKKVGHGLVVNAMSLDGVVEGVEDPQYKFCIGVQWHPEYGVTESDTQLFEAFVKSCIHE